MTVYVFLVSRPSDKGLIWPCVYTDHDLAKQAFGRVSQIVKVDLREIKNVMPVDSASESTK